MYDFPHILHPCGFLLVSSTCAFCRGFKMKGYQKPFATFICGSYLLHGTINDMLVLKYKRLNNIQQFICHSIFKVNTFNRLILRSPDWENILKYSSNSWILSPVYAIVPPLTTIMSNFKCCLTVITPVQVFSSMHYPVPFLSEDWSTPSPLISECYIWCGVSPVFFNMPILCTKIQINNLLQI